MKTVDNAVAKGMLFKVQDPCLDFQPLPIPCRMMKGRARVSPVIVLYTCLSPVKAQSLRSEPGFNLSTVFLIQPQMSPPLPSASVRGAPLLWFEYPLGNLRPF